MADYGLWVFSASDIAGPRMQAVRFTQLFQGVLHIVVFESQRQRFIVYGMKACRTPALEFGVEGILEISCAVWQLGHV